ncbi:hypothetical protein [Mesorhizobium sp. CO1-1-8]|uniref:hypothetical protein n=1 Tax=Mesorhizobium sp. CO1-1-8 TaxID=2876631 RepID=UPI001CD0D6DB|nr:hypothetical protein [Mesorhizobium sp. CO1-1-8]MBZ9772321.1 hypothetical protein [Mesorhizobium sp. CO1-1-8]
MTNRKDKPTKIDIDRDDLQKRIDNGDDVSKHVQKAAKALGPKGLHTQITLMPGKTSGTIVGCIKIDPHTGQCVNYLHFDDPMGHVLGKMLLNHLENQ